ncbi:tRNA (5-methylaminomethyl-2-thiouridine)(34)-methyltransferase MnmD [Halosquirtibacter xylanolyticus]|uniref:tRNA (5-methylaminomethyl-2-thiouridine)(34)-methyltransferase MnmD n=1 Tax=Halosquirtibacter xylanolyticus TaxID=3374599 RepID=UPI00374A5028|nr:tRNA (5-methylaminomethyl-2-thiouridine)(34)-methyltransferase MnmD [Prolixibacteraceae bacterium]
MDKHHLKREVTQTEDGSVTLFIPELDEHYHSVHGAVQESRHVFIEAGLRHSNLECLTILEAGFGTGLNALLTYFEAKCTGRKVHFVTMEKYPLVSEEYCVLNYGHLVDEQDGADVLMALHNAPWGEKVVMSDFFSITKLHVDMKHVKWDDIPPVDLVYYDAFAPDIQPSLWSDTLFESVVNTMSSNGILTTYCAKGVVRRSLQSAGLTMERLPGPPGKREMLRGVKR